MKYLITLITCFVLATGLSPSAPIALQRGLQAPPYSELLKDPQTTAFKLKALLDAGKLEEFYQKADEAVKNINEENGKTLDKEQLHDRLWLFYYIAAAPFFAMDDNPDEVFPWFKSRFQDYLTKSRATSYIARPEIDSSSKQNQLFISLSANYCVQIIKDLRCSYNPDLEKQQPIKEERFLEQCRTLLADKKLTFEQFEKRVKLFQYRASTMERRNDMIKNDMLFMEKDFTTMLTRYFSGNVTKIKQYIKQAGYTDKEIPDLLNRTVGRNAKTEFLYKGTGKRHKSS